MTNELDAIAQGARVTTTTERSMHKDEREAGILEGTSGDISDPTPQSEEAPPVARGLREKRPVRAGGWMCRTNVKAGRIIRFIYADAPGINGDGVTS